MAFPIYFKIAVFVLKYEFFFKLHTFPNAHIACLDTLTILRPFEETTSIKVSDFNYYKFALTFYGSFSCIMTTWKT